jgi:chromatin segregation and condensation protein Rec8/ScpA/Scc1 (kleisin family)
MQYIYCMNEMYIEVASEFIVMAAKLIEIKSKSSAEFGG